MNRRQLLKSLAAIPAGIVAARLPDVSELAVESAPVSLSDVAYLECDRYPRFVPVLRVDSESVSLTPQQLAQMNYELGNCSGLYWDAARHIVFVDGPMFVTPDRYG